MAASALKQRGKESRITTKAIEIQTIIHQQIIELGNELYKKTTEHQQHLFEDHLLKHESRLVVKLEEKKFEALEDLRRSQQDELEKLRLEYLELQNLALKEEAQRVEEIMERKAFALVRKTELEGQQKLDKALLDARRHFDVEKAKTIEEMIIKLRKENEERLEKERLSYQKVIDELNEEWKLKIKEKEATFRQKLTENLDKQRQQLDEMYEEQLQNKLVALQEKHDSELQKQHEEISGLEKANDDLKDTIKGLDNSLEDMKSSMKQILGTFRQFVESCPGFEEGQADFVLESLVPDNIEDFLRQ